MLPQINLPKYKVELISTGKKHTFRPYTVKEEEILALARESENLEDITEAIVNLINNCVEGVDARTLPIFDFEYLFLKLKTVSSGDKIELIVPHQSETDCDHKQIVEIDLNNLKIKNNPDHSKDIKINDQIGVVMKYPSFLDISTKSNVEMFVDSIDYIYDEENVYKNSTFEEKKEWLMLLDKISFNKIQKFFETSPKVYLEITWTCQKCGKTETRIEEGIDRFFL
jgi:hypothetical protein